LIDISALGAARIGRRTKSVFRRLEAVIFLLRLKVLGVRPIEKKGKTVLFWVAGDLANLKIEVVVIEGFRLAGYEVHVFSPPNTGIKKIWQALSVRYIEEDRESMDTDSIADKSQDFVKNIVQHATTWDDLKRISVCGVQIGTHASATFMRETKLGEIDIRKKQTRTVFLKNLSRSMEAIGRAKDLLAQSKPDAIVLFDRGYTPRAELFDLCMQRDVPAYTINAGHRDGCLVIKRYTKKNSTAHPLTLSDHSWDFLQNRGWTTAIEEKIKREISECYSSGEWYGEVGTQFNKKQITKEQLFRKLELDPDKKLAVIYPHMFWDGTFFWGHDLFPTYQEWFAQTLLAAAGNSRINWIIKIHPANVVKANRDGVTPPKSEQDIVAEVLGPLPENFKMLDASSQISTLSLHLAADYCVTVRGTVGIEAACFGVTVLTAGTGRYDQKGFTVDSETTEEYLKKIRHIHEVAPIGSERVKAAQIYAYGTFLSRILKLISVRQEFRKDEVATNKTKNNWRNWAELEGSRDVRTIARYIQSGAEDYLKEEFDFEGDG
jgi:hypothetical protein